MIELIYFQSNRSFRLVMAELCSFAPTILSAAGSGFWVNQLGFSLVFFIIFLFNIVILLYAVFLVPETIRRDPEARLLSLQYVKKAVTVSQSVTTVLYAVTTIIGSTHCYHCYRVCTLLPLLWSLYTATTAMGSIYQHKRFTLEKCLPYV